jgi:hypothetical protein
MMIQFTSYVRSFLTTGYYLNLWGSIYLLASICIPSPISAMTFPQDFDYSQRLDVLLDNNELWDINSIFNPIEVLKQDSISLNKTNDAYCWVREYLIDYSALALDLKKNALEGLSVMLIPGIGSSFQYGSARTYKQLAFNQFLWSDLRFRKNWYARIYFRLTNEGASLPHYSGIPRGISRAGLNTGEIDQSIIGFENSWANLELGRSREIWGPFKEENLLLSGTAPSYERLMIQVQHKKITYRWFFGFLETIIDTSNSEDIQRYIVGKAVEYTNRKNFIVGLGEVSIIAGPNRPIDLSYLNPLAFHLDVDMNQRSNATNIRQNNAIWFLHFDWRPLKPLRLSGSFIVDEFQLDQKDRDEGRTDALGWSTRAAWTSGNDDVGFTLFVHHILLDTYTMQYQNKGYLNFVTRDQLLGQAIGNDAEKALVGIRITSSDLPIMLELEYGQFRWGSNSLRLDTYKPYENFIEVPFPSGDVKINKYFSCKLRSHPMKGLSVNIDGHFDIQHSGENSAFEAWTLSVRYQIPFLISGS